MLEKGALIFLYNHHPLHTTTYFTKSIMTRAATNAVPIAMYSVSRTSYYTIIIIHRT